MITKPHKRIYYSAFNTSDNSTVPNWNGNKEAQTPAQALYLCQGIESYKWDCYDAYVLDKIALESGDYSFSNLNSIPEVFQW